MGLLRPLNPFQGYGVYPCSYGRDWVDAHIQTQIRIDSYLKAFSEGHFIAIHLSINSLHPHIYAQGHEGAGAFPSMHPG